MGWIFSFEFSRLIFSSLLSTKSCVVGGRSELGIMDYTGKPVFYSSSQNGRKKRNENRKKAAVIPAIASVRHLRNCIWGLPLLETAICMQLQKQIHYILPCFGKSSHISHRKYKLHADNSTVNSKNFTQAVYHPYFKFSDCLYWHIQFW